MDRCTAGEVGSSLLETAVAAALLLTVLVPAAGSIAYFTAQDQNAELARATVAAHHIMEEALSESEPRTSTYSLVGVGRVTLDVARRGELTVYDVMVRHAKREMVLARYVTARPVP